MEQELKPGKMPGWVSRKTIKKEDELENTELTLIEILDPDERVQ